MPPDTTDIINFQQRLDSLGEAYKRELSERGPDYMFPQWLMFLFILAVALTSIYFYIIRPAVRERKRRINRYRNPEEGAEAREARYHDWFMQYNSYYAALSTENKKRFIERTICFLESKEFRFHSMGEEEHIPVLISGAAVQITFGLSNYLMDYFSVIHVIRKEYTLHFNKETYHGHVSKSGIYISWPRFMEGYQNYKDSDNLGLHELAHAISYDCIFGDEDRHDRQFKDRMEQFYMKGNAIFKGSKIRSLEYFDPYALSDFDEFWAFCIEQFFENSEVFRTDLPDLYLSIAELLNQDPLSNGFILNRRLAGLAFQEKNN